MPVSAYFKGKGDRVLADLIRRYGEKKGRAVFYALAAKRNLKPKKQVRRAGGRR